MDIVIKFEWEQEGARQYSASKQEGHLKQQLEIQLKRCGYEPRGADTIGSQSDCRALIIRINVLRNSFVPWKTSYCRQPVFLLPQLDDVFILIHY